MQEEQQQEQTAAQYEVHDMALQFPDQSPEEKRQLKENMVQRVHQGLAPLESPILLVGGKIADGRHRYKIWQELAEESACDGYFAKNPPPVEEIAALEPDGETTVLLRINSRNLCHRTLPAGQKAAIFQQQVEKFPSLKLIVEKIRSENEERMKAGKRLDNGSQGSSTNEVIAKMAGVSPSTMKTVKALQEKAPEQFAEVAKGNISAKAASKKAAQAEEAEKPKNKEADKPKSENQTPVTPKPPLKIRAGDKVFTLQQYEFGAGDIALLEHIVLKVEDTRCHFEDGSTKAISAVYDLNGATRRRQEMLKTELESVVEEAGILRKAAKQKPTILPYKSTPKA